MRIAFNGQLSDERRVRAGFIGCGSHAFRNVYPAFQFTPVELVATCDLQLDKARAYAKQFGAQAAYDDVATMLGEADIEAVFIVTNYDDQGRPRYPDLVVQALEAGKHVWIEKPPAATCADIERMQAAAKAAGRCVVVGFKKAFAPANAKAAELSRRDDFGDISLITLQYPQYVPTVDAMAHYAAGERRQDVVSFLDHLCHPMSLLTMLHGMPRDLIYQRSRHGAGVATFSYDDGVVATLAMTDGAANDGGMERTMIVSATGRHILVENNTRVTLRRTPPGLGYGTSPSYFTGEPGEVSSTWEPEVSLGQLYNKSLFLLGYWSEVQAFTDVILSETPRAVPGASGASRASGASGASGVSGVSGVGTLEQAWQVTRIFEAFAEGPGKLIRL